LSRAAGEADAQLKPYSLTPGEAMFVLHLMQFKWDDAAPFPGYKRIAAQMGISHKMARTHAKSLETKKLLRREMRVSPLFDALNDVPTGAKEKPKRRSPQRVTKTAAAPVRKTAAGSSDSPPGSW
jgi:Helix-turn-helix domain